MASTDLQIHYEFAPSFSGLIISSLLLGILLTQSLPFLKSTPQRLPSSSPSLRLTLTSLLLTQLISLIFACVYNFTKLFDLLLRDIVPGYVNALGLVPGGIDAFVTALIQSYLLVLLWLHGPTAVWLGYISTSLISAIFIQFGAAITGIILFARHGFAPTSSPDNGATTALILSHSFSIGISLVLLLVLLPIASLKRRSLALVLPMVGEAITLALFVVARGKGLNSIPINAFSPAYSLVLLYFLSSSTITATSQPPKDAEKGDETNPPAYTRHDSSHTATDSPCPSPTSTLALPHRSSEAVPPTGDELVENEQRTLSYSRALAQYAEAMVFM